MLFPKLAPILIYLILIIYKINSLFSLYLSFTSRISSYTSISLPTIYSTNTFLIIYLATLF